MYALAYLQIPQVFLHWASISGIFPPQIKEATSKQLTMSSKHGFPAIQRIAYNVGYTQQKFRP